MSAAFLLASAASHNCFRPCHNKLRVIILSLHKQLFGQY